MVAAVKKARDDGLAEWAELIRILVSPFHGVGNRHRGKNHRSTDLSWSIQAKRIINEVNRIIALSCSNLNK